MRKLQKQYSADFKARVVVSALSEDRTLNEMASRSPDDALEADLYEQIGRLKVELEWLKKWGPGLEERRAMIELGPPEISVRRQRPAQIRSTVVRRTGSASDLEKATEIATYMVMKFGMSEKIGRVSYGFENERQNQKPRSEETKKAIDAEVNSFVEDAYQTARTTLESNWEVFKAAAEELRTKETLRGEDFDRLIPKAKNPGK